MVEMPSRAPRVCAWRGCPWLTRGRYCEEHERADLERLEAARKQKTRSARPWRRKRAEVLARQPFCACGAAATEVDHIVPVEDEGTDADENLQGICNRCHRSKTAGEVSRRGRGGG